MNNDIINLQLSVQFNSKQPTDCFEGSLQFLQKNIAIVLPTTKEKQKIKIIL